MLVQRHGEFVAGQIGHHSLAHRPANNAAGIQIADRGQIQPTLIGEAVWIRVRASECITLSGLLVPTTGPVPSSL